MKIYRTGYTLEEIVNNNADILFRWIKHQRSTNILMGISGLCLLGIVWMQDKQIDQLKKEIKDIRAIQTLNSWKKDEEKES